MVITYAPKPNMTYHMMREQKQGAATTELTTLSNIPRLAIRVQLQRLEDTKKSLLRKMGMIKVYIQNQKARNYSIHQGGNHARVIWGTNIGLWFYLILAMLLSIGIANAEQCNETWRPCVYDSEMELVECRSTDMTAMFQEVTNFNESIGDISQWNTSCITEMSYMFYGATDFDQDISGWDTSNVQGMDYMFAGANDFNQDIGSWDTSNVLSMSGMFFEARSFDQDISGWVTGSVSDMSDMFSYAESFNQPVGVWDVSHVSGMSNMFRGAVSFDQDIGSWDTSNVLSMSGMFFEARSFDQDISGWVTGSVSDMSDMFSYAESFDQPIGVWDVSHVSGMNNMFYRAESFNQDIGSWDTSNVMYMDYMFAGATMFNQDISTWDVGNVIYMFSMFENAPVFNQPIGSWDVSHVSDMNNMFYQASSFDQDIGSWDVSSVVNMQGMLIGVELSTENYDALLIGWSSQNVQPNVMFDAVNSHYSVGGILGREILIEQYGWIITDLGLQDTMCNETWRPCIYDSDNELIECRNTDMTGMFQGILNFNETVGNISGWDTSCITEMDYMFSGAVDFNQDISGWDTHNVADMDYMFAGANDFDQDIGSWDTSNVLSMSGMFFEALAFNRDISRWDTGNVNDMNEMFAYAESFNQPIGAWNVSHVNDMSNMFYEARSFNQNISGWDTGSVSDMSDMFAYAVSFDQPIGSWDVSHVSNMSNMFYEARSFNQNISGWDTGSVSDMSDMFAYAVSFDQPIGSWDVSHVSNMSNMFYEALSFDQDVGLWDVGAVTSMVGMFEGGVLSIGNYDSLFVGWSNQIVQPNVIFDADNSVYSVRGLSGRNILVRNYGWIITDLGLEDSIPQNESKNKKYAKRSKGSSGQNIIAVCAESWKCQEWSKCDRNNERTRECRDINSCGTAEYEPITVESCDYKKSIIDKSKEKVKNVKSKALFDIILDIIREPAVGDPLMILKVSLINFGSRSMIDVNLTYTILDEKGMIVYEKRETVPVVTQTEFTQSLNVSLLSEGKYTLHAELVYEGQEEVARARKDFSIGRSSTGRVKIYLLIGFLTSCALLAVFLVYRKTTPWLSGLFANHKVSLIEDHKSRNSPKVFADAITPSQVKSNPTTDTSVGEVIQEKGGVVVPAKNVP